MCRSSLFLAMAFVGTMCARAIAAERLPVIAFPAGPGRPVAAAEMQRVYEEVRTPHKFGVVIRGEPGEMVDCPSVFRHGGRWFMLYAGIKDNAGYQTFLARSDDLLHWQRLGPILSLRREGWDAFQADGGVALYDVRWENGTHELGMHNGKYWLSYIGGAKPGYEPDPLAIGLAFTANPAAAVEWTRHEENPVLSPAQADTRAFERTTLYKSTIIRDERESTGWPFVMFYNAKCPPDGNETIGMAVSRDLMHWQRYGDGPVIAHRGASRWAISGDPQIARIGGLWVMFYFGAFWKPKAFDTFACSRDLVHWTAWDGPHLVEPSEPFDREFAHKPWLLKHGGVVYHFYCAVGSEGRVIALATSKDLRADSARQP